MPINIHGREYLTVAERLKMAHDDDFLHNVETEVLCHTPVVIRAVLTTKTKGIFTGISAADPTKMLEKKSPYEVAETSAVGRALAFAGYAGTEIASYDEMVKAGAVKKKDIDYNEPPKFNSKGKIEEEDSFQI